MQFAVDYLKEETKKHTSGPDEVQDLRRLWVAKEDDLADEFRKFLNEKNYLIVVNDLSTMDEWDQIRTCFPTNKKGSRLLVCTEHVKLQACVLSHPLCYCRSTSNCSLIKPSTLSMTR
jgi:hypothetical protein